MHVNYNDLVANYYKNLENNLRGFSGGPGFLSVWAHDEDPTRSLMSIIDLAIEDGHEILTIKSSQEVADQFKGYGDHKEGVVYRDNEQIGYMTNRAVRVHDTVKHTAKDFGYNQIITFVSLKKNVLTLDYEDDTMDKPLHLGLMAIEEKVNKILNERLDIQTLNVDDRNKRSCAKH